MYKYRERLKFLILLKNGETEIDFPYLIKNWCIFIAFNLFQGVLSYGFLEIQLIKYANKYGRSKNGSRCPKTSENQDLYRCTNIFKLRLSSGSFSQSITTQAFQEAAYAKTVKFRNKLNVNKSNPWKINLTRVEVWFVRKDYFALSVCFKVKNCIEVKNFIIHINDSEINGNLSTRKQCQKWKIRTKYGKTL